MILTLILCTLLVYSQCYDLRNFEVDINTTEISPGNSVNLCSNLRWKPDVMESNKNKIPSLIFESSVPKCVKIEGCDNSGA